MFNLTRMHHRLMNNIMKYIDWINQNGSFYCWRFAFLIGLYDEAAICPVNVVKNTWKVKGGSERRRSNLQFASRDWRRGGGCEPIEKLLSSSVFSRLIGSWQATASLADILRNTCAGATEWGNRGRFKGSLAGNLGRQKGKEKKWQKMRKTIKMENFYVY